MNKHKHCDYCRQRLLYVAYYDAYCCRQCDVWHTKPCSLQEGKCQFCDELRKVPRPSDAPDWVWEDPCNFLA